MRFPYLIILLALCLCSCSTDEPISSVGVTAEDNVYLDLNKWIYGQMNRQYLWRDDLPDSMKCDYNLPPKDFFKSLLSPKDRFSYFTTNENYNPSKSYSSLGFAFQKLKDKEGHIGFEVLYVNSQRLKGLGLHRGDYVKIEDLRDSFRLTILQLENQCFVESTKIIEASRINPFESSTVLLDSIYRMDNKIIGYLCYLEYGDKEDLQKPLINFSDNHITDLILDLRYNPGGLVSTCRFLCNCIVPENGYSKIFQQCSYNDILSRNYFFETGDSRTYSYFERPGETLGEQLGVVLTSLNVNKLYVITSSHTASASEATIICLQPYMSVVKIGEKTVGKGVGSWTISDPRFRYAIQPITMRYYNADGLSTPDDGIEPDVYIPDGYSTGKLEIGDINEKLLNGALSYIRGDKLVEMSTRSHNSENSLTPIGEPSYVTEFNNKQYNESN